MRYTLGIGALCAAYAILGSVIWSAHEEFGSHSLHDRAPLAVAERAPFKLLPEEATPGGTPRIAEHRGEGSGVTARASDAGTRITGVRQAMAPHQTESLAATETGSGAHAPLVTARESSPPELGIAAPAAIADEAFHSDSAATRPPAPALKPLDAMPVVVTEAVLPAPRQAIGLAGLGGSPPVPAPKPIVMPPRQRPGSSAEPDTRLAAASGPASLPDALRIFWANLKILLASGPALRVVPAGGNDSHRWADRSGGGGGFADAGSGRSSNSGNGNGGGRSSSDSGGSSSGSSGSSGGSSSEAGGSGGASGVSSGGGKGGKSDKGVGRGDGGKGGGKGGKGGGRGGRGGDDDDDDDD